MTKGTRPYTRGEIAAYLLELENLQKENKLVLTNPQAWLVDKLKDEFKYEISTLKLNVFDQSLKYNLDPIGAFNSAQEKKPVRTRLKIAGSFQNKDRFLIRIRGTIDNQAEQDPEFLGRKWKKGLSGVVDQSYLHFDTKFLKILLGRDNQNWGPTFSEGLLLSGKSPPLDQIRLESQVGYFKFSFLTSVLDKIFVPDSGNGALANRYISAHRVNFKHPKGIELGFSEVVVYGGLNRQLELYYLNPILPYYVEQFNHKGVDDNILWSLDFDLSFWKDKEFYGEFLIDDFQYDFKSEPNQLGYLVGSKLANLLGWQGSFLNLEYSRIRFWVYGDTQPWNRLLFHDVGLGSPLGPDADRIKGSFLYQLRKDFSLQTLVIYKRKGEGKIAIPYPSPLPEVPKFPSGIVEKTTSIELLGIFQPHARLKIDLGLQLLNRKNISNIADKNIKGEFSLNLKMEYNFWKEKGI